MISSEEVAAIRRGIAKGRKDYETLYLYYTGHLTLEGSMYEAFLNIGTNRYVATEAFPFEVFDDLDELEGRARKRTLCGEARRLSNLIATSSQGQ